MRNTGRSNVRATPRMKVCIFHFLTDVPRAVLHRGAVRKLAVAFAHYPLEKHVPEPLPIVS